MKAERAEPCKVSRKPSRPVVAHHRLWAQANGHWNWSKGNYDITNATRVVDGEIVEPTFPPSREPDDD